MTPIFPREEHYGSLAGCTLPEPDPNYTLHSSSISPIQESADPHTVSQSVHSPSRPVLKARTPGSCARLSPKARHTQKVEDDKEEERYAKKKKRIMEYRKREKKRE